MKVSVQILQQFIGKALPSVDELVDIINRQLGGVENVSDLAAIYKDAKIVKIVECEKHPNADRLNVCKIDAGTGELIQVVCGAPNARADMWAVWLPPASVVPATYADAEPFVLDARELRGVMSHGMLAAGDELAINADHDGIVEVTLEDLPQNAELRAGIEFAQTFGLDDTVIEIENKMFTHRPDCFGQLGVAIELAGILGEREPTLIDHEDVYNHRAKLPEWYWGAKSFTRATGLPLEVRNEAGSKVPRLMAVALKDVTIAPSPLWLQCALVALGSKPINNVVDITNYLMLMTAQPSHAYDYDKLRGATLTARLASDGEKVELLNGKTYELHVDDVVMADEGGAIGVAGIMGGANSDITHETKNIVLEVATFDMYGVRKTSMRHGLFTDALTRFNKGQSPLQNDRVMGQLIALITQMAGGSQASDVADIVDPALDQARADSSFRAELKVEPDFINTRLGLTLSGAQIEQLLRNVWFACYAEKGESAISFTAPFWRTDIEIPEDIVEEVGRLYGLDKLPRELPQKSISPTVKNVSIEAKQHIREALSRAGGNEVLTYSFVHHDMLTRSGQDPDQAFRLSNALSPDLQYYRLSVLPSLLDKVHMNIKAGHAAFMLYEIGKAHHNELFDEQGLPKELDRVAGVYAQKASGDGSAYYAIRRVVDFLTSAVVPNARVTYTRLDRFEVPHFAPFEQALAPFDPLRSAIVEIDGKLAGVAGELRAAVRKAHKLPDTTSTFELYLSPFVGEQIPRYTPLSRYQSVERDVTFRVDESITYGQVVEASAYEEDGLALECRALDIYQAEGGSHKNITLRFLITPYNKTLTAEDATQVTDEIVKRVVAATGAQVL
ncbi:TPA: phenylalanine--tRNA ligase subunit beta [Candidatus Saccharibacteria bacterium]|nr:phenylalanine--tRNA ligase subunit beta [Candidatus Saccharibacteria bacterium]